ncbi:MAG: CvpA family protein, partial [Acidimicrobiales bacterium]
MTLFDVGLVLVMVAAALGGSRLGLVTRAWSWLGLGIGLVVATRLAGPVVAPLDDQEAFVRLLATLVVVVICAGVGQSIGFAIGNRLWRTLPDSLRSVDRVAGAVSGVLVVFVVVWLLLPTLTMMEGTLARLARGSTIVAAVDRYSPPVPPSVRDLGQQVSDFGFPEVFDDLRAAPEVGPAPESLGLPVAVVDRVRPSTMNIEARGCGGIHEGSGFVVEAELVA